MSREGGAKMDRLKVVSEADNVQKTSLCTNINFFSIFFSKKIFFGMEFPVAIRLEWL